MRKNNKAFSAMVVMLALFLGVGGFTLIQRGKAAAGDLVITGRGDAPADPKTLTPSQTNAIGSGPTAPPPSQSASEVVIHVAGAVNHPGVYHLPLTARVEDAVKASGGAKPDADLDAINLAAHVEDGKQLRIPKRGEVARTTTPYQGGQSPTPVPLTLSPSFSTGSGQASAPHPKKLSDPGQGTININTASEEELQQLPGIGPSYASRIVQFRSQYGAFSSADQLRDIPGIGEKRFAKIRAFVRIQ